MLFDDIHPIVENDPDFLGGTKGNGLISILKVTNDARISLPRNIFKKVGKKESYARFEGKVDSIDVVPIYKINHQQ